MIKFEHADVFGWMSDETAPGEPSQPITTENSLIWWYKGYPFQKGGRCGAIYPSDGLYYFKNGECSKEKPIVCEAIKFP